MLIARTFESINIAAAVTEFDLDRLAKAGERHYFSLSFLDASGNPVAANTLTGAVVVQLSDNGVDYGDPIDGTINLSEALVVPHAAGNYIKAKVDLSGITATGAAESVDVTVLTYG